MRRRMVLLVISLAILSVPGSAAQVATPDPAELPEATAPFGLSGLVLPVTGEEVRALLDRLPDTLGGERRGLAQEEDGRVRVAWGAESMPFGQPITLGVLHFPTSDFFPADFTAGNYVAVTMLTDDAQVAAGGRDGDLVWVWAEISVGAVGPSDATPAARGSLPLPPIRRSGSRHLWGVRRGDGWRGGCHTSGVTTPDNLWKIGCMCGPIVLTRAVRTARRTTSHDRHSARSHGRAPADRRSPPARLHPRARCGARQALPGARSGIRAGDRLHGD